MVMKEMLFRVDGNSKIGMGHIMRCLSIADAAKCSDFNCIFILSDVNCVKIVQERGYETIVLNTNYNELDSEDVQIRLLIKEKDCDVFFVDSYFVTYQYLSKVYMFLKEKNSLLVCMDCNADFTYPCDVLINYNIYGPSKRNFFEERYRNSKYTIPLLLLGTEYVPLRQEFYNMSIRNVHEKAEKVLISTGGADWEQLTLEIVNQIICQKSELEFHIIIGCLNRDRYKIENICANVENIILHYDVKNMKALMQEMDVAVSAAGSTLYELCATQTPTITYILADNQIMGAQQFSKHGVMINAGDISQLGSIKLSKNIIFLVNDLVNDYSARCDMSKKMKEIVDGNGAYKIVKELVSIYP